MQNSRKATKTNVTGSVRYNPYVSNNRSYLGQYKKNIKNSNSTPRKRVYKSVTLKSCRRSLDPHLKTSLTEEEIKCVLSEDDAVDNISNTAEVEANADEDPLQLSPTKETKLNKQKIISSIPHKSPSLCDVYEISDDEFDKENTNTTMFNSFYKKEVTPKRSHSVLLEISPAVENFHSNEANLSTYNKVKTLQEYKFRRIEHIEEKPHPEYPHLVGFLNYGNTCYLNSVLQSLMGLRPFTYDLSNAQCSINLSPKTITQSMSELIFGREKCNSDHVHKALRSVKENIERFDEGFAGVKMQDANEFLTRILECINDEVGKYLVPTRSAMMPSPTKWRCSDSTDHLSSKDYVFESSISSNESSDSFQKADDIEVTFRPMPETCPQSIINPVMQNFGFELIETYKCLGCDSIVTKTQQNYLLYVNLPKEDDAFNIQKSVEDYMSEDQREVTCDKCGHEAATVTISFAKLPRILIVQLKRYEYNHEQFECAKLSVKVDLNAWLYLGNLTSNSVDTAPPWTPQPIVIPYNVEPDITIDESVSSSEQVDGIKIGTMSVTSPVCDEVPDALQVVPLDESSDKEEEDLQLAIKLSLQTSRVCYSTDDTSDETSSEETFSEDDDHAYRLLSVISHFGQTPSTGHYVADVLNCTERQWYHYDDELVDKLQEAVVLAELRQKNAYIYFYADRKLYEDLSKTTDT